MLEVENHGPGVAPADQGRIFARFERASDVHKKESLGLGSYTVRSIAEAHAATQRGCAAGARNWVPVRGRVCSCGSAPGGVSRQARPPVAAAYPAVVQPPHLVRVELHRVGPDLEVLRDRRQVVVHPAEQAERVDPEQLAAGLRVERPTSARSPRSSPPGGRCTPGRRTACRRRSTYASDPASGCRPAFSASGSRCRVDAAEEHAGRGPAVHVQLGEPPAVHLHLDRHRREEPRDRRRRQQDLPVQLLRVRPAAGGDRPHVPDHQPAGVDVGGADVQPPAGGVGLGHGREDGVVHLRRRSAA